MLHGKEFFLTFFAGLIKGCYNSFLQLGASVGINQVKKLLKEIGW